MRTIGTYSLALILALAAVFCTPATAQEKQEKTKHGYNHVPYPIVGIDEDLGFQYGLHYSFFDYGDGSIYPNYRHKLVIEGSRFTGGQSEAAFTYQSDYLIPGIRFQVALSYKDNPFTHFYGFNGSVNPIDKSLDRKDGIAYYDIRRRFARAATSFQGQIGNGLVWAAGVNFMSYKIGDLNPKYGYDPTRSLYHDYISSGIIKADQAEGGNVLEFCAGLVYDTRNALSMPTSGMLSEIYFTGAPDVFKTGYGFSRLSAHHRHYIPLGSNERVVIAYHLAWQQKLGGEMPFYVLQNITNMAKIKSVSEGLGNKSTLRITRINRLVGEGYAWANLEARIRLVDFVVKNQAIMLGANPFFDCGRITTPYHLGADKGSALYKEATKLHYSAGLGFKFVMNRNFISSFELAKPFYKDDGGWKVLIGGNFAF